MRKMTGVKRYVRLATSHDRLKTKRTTGIKSSVRTKRKTEPVVMTGKEAKPMSAAEWGAKITNNGKHQLVIAP